MTNYAYLDKYGILHITNDSKQAAKYAKLNGKVLATTIDSYGGYPITTVRKDTEMAIVAYSAAKFEVDGKKVNAANFPEVVALYKSLA